MKAIKSHELLTDVPASELWKIYGTLRLEELVRQLLPQEFVKIDNKNYIKELVAIEGDFLNLGFTKYVTRFEVIQKGLKSSVIKSSVVYEFDDGRPELEAPASTTPLALAARAIVKYVKKQKATETSS
ncbi:hypothetical protein PR202_gb14508 [Eleusine coracana subsp. coracana]|uniref:Bet v I/Major latex protein domain-containing protein n=1 Tax=Eleusine coracana subsp. coracana TaxID=191504 RepID=A0AAV5EUS7_ELECO|nr:hypothetical protein PR202_gb14508 [Eleusine coracana subsp. coracana]